MKLRKGWDAKLTPEQRKEAEALLAELQQRHDDNPLLRYHPHPKQHEFHRAQTRLKAFIGGNRSGKTEASIADDLIQAVDADALPDHLRPYKKWEPPFYCRIVSPDFTSTMEGVVFEKLRKLAPKSQLQGGNWERAYDKQRRVLRFKNGSWFDFLTSEQDIDKFSGAALHRVHFDEEPPGEKGFQIYKECRMRLIDYGGDMVFSMTPLMGLSWVYDEVWEKRHLPHVTAIQVDMDDNPYLREQEKAAALEGYSKEERDARKSGRFVHFSGLFYPEFGDVHITVQPGPDDLKEMEIVCGIDPGLNTTGVVWIAFDNDNSALVFDELYTKDEIVQPIAEEIHRRNAFWGVEPINVIDPSARFRNGINGEQIESAYMRAGIYTQHGENARGPGILEVKRRLQNRTLLVAEECRTLRWEFGRYRKDPNATDEFRAVKKDDHLLDALRYAVMSRAWHLPTPNRPKREPFYEPPWSGPDPLPAPPMGSFS